jgi:uncharacterized Zn finger protein
MTDGECPACSNQHVLSHQHRKVYDGVLFWSCEDCGFTWPRFISPLSGGLVQASINAAEEYEPHTRRSDRARTGLSSA